jgi:predicted DNA-binding transcriptional regulator AlpA
VTDRLMRMRQLPDKVGLSESRIFELVRAQRFPPPTRIDGSTLWSENEIDRWISERLADRRGQNPWAAVAPSPQPGARRRQRNQR